VSLSIKNWDWDELPKRKADIWDALLYTIFLGATVRSAQANYIKEVLGDLINFKAAQTVPSDPIWSKKVLKVIDSELGSISGTPGEGFKRAILQTVAIDAKNLDLSRTIGTALSFFQNYNIDVQRIKSLQNGYQGTLDLVAAAAHEIHNVRYIKGVLWLYGCGIAKDLVPPNAHVTRFLDECGYTGFGWSRDVPEDWQIFAIVCNKMRDVAKQVGTELKRQITPKQAQAGVWYLQTCRGLLPRNYRRKLTPLALTQFLKRNRWDIKELHRKVADVEQLEGLAADLEAFL
jgi:hypothetical protein